MELKRLPQPRLLFFIEFVALYVGSLCRCHGGRDAETRVSEVATGFLCNTAGAAVKPGLPIPASLGCTPRKRPRTITIQLRVVEVGRHTLAPHCLRMVQ